VLPVVAIVDDVAPVWSAASSTGVTGNDLAPSSVDPGAVNRGDPAVVLGSLKLLDRPIVVESTVSSLRRSSGTDLRRGEALSPPDQLPSTSAATQ